MYVDSGHNHLGIKGVFNYDEIPSNKTLSELGFSKIFIIEQSFTRGKKEYNYIWGLVIYQKMYLLNRVLIYFKMDLNLLWG